MSGSSRTVLQSSKFNLLSSSVIPGHALSPPDPFHFSKQTKKEENLIEEVFWINFSQSINTLIPHVFFNPLLAQNLREKKVLAKLVWSRGMPRRFACNFDRFQVGFHAEHLFL